MPNSDWETLSAEEKIQRLLIEKASHRDLEALQSRLTKAEDSIAHLTAVTDKLLRDFNAIKLNRVTESRGQ